jgi:hypothetical protein
MQRWLVLTKSLKVNSENIAGFKIPSSEYNRIFKNTLEPHMNGRRHNLKYPKQAADFIS